MGIPNSLKGSYSQSAIRTNLDIWSPEELVSRTWSKISVQARSMSLSLQLQW